MKLILFHTVKPVFCFVSFSPLLKSAIAKSLETLVEFFTAASLAPQYAALSHRKLSPSDLASSGEEAMACMAALAGASVAIGAHGVTGTSSPAVPALCSSSSSSAPLLLRRSFSGPAVRLSVRRAAESGRFAPLPVRAVSSDDSTPDATKQIEELYGDLKAKWDGVENKPTVLIYAGGAVVALWLSSTIVGAINSVPVLPKLMELIGLGYTGWFVYRYLLFKSNRKELVADIEELKGRVTGATKEESF